MKLLEEQFSREIHKEEKDRGGERKKEKERKRERSHLR